MNPMDTAPETEVIWEVLRTIPDPEYGLSIVDMGLIYQVECNEGNIAVTMTLTTPNCPPGEWIYEGVKAALQGAAPGKTVEVALVCDPAWTPAMLTEAGRRQLGMD